MEVTAAVTLPAMKKALMNTFGGRLSDGEASRMAEFVMNFFGYGDRILDNFLESSDRNIFYMLEDEGLVHSSQEEVIVNVGQRWRLSFWVLKKGTVLQRSSEGGPTDEAMSAQSFYEALWRSMAEAEEAQTTLPP